MYSVWLQRRPLRVIFFPQCTMECEIFTGGATDKWSKEEALSTVLDVDMDEVSSLELSDDSRL